MNIKYIWNPHSIFGFEIETENLCKTQHCLLQVDNYDIHTYIRIYVIFIKTEHHGNYYILLNNIILLWAVKKHDKSRRIFVCFN
jgi:hypothetical protein